MTDRYVNDDGSASFGSVEIADDVIATIANVAAESVEGVAKLKSSLKLSVTDMLGGKSSTGIKVNVGEREAIIDIFISVEYSRNLVEVAKNVQKSVKEAIETMAGIEVVAVNVHVSGITLVQENEE